MADDEKTKFYCSFCGKAQDEVKKLIAGPSVFICNECIVVAVDAAELDKPMSGIEELRASKVKLQDEILTVVREFEQENEGMVVAHIELFRTAEIAKPMGLPQNVHVELRVE